MNINGLNSDAPHWYALYTVHKQENRAESNLRAWGVKTLNPKIRVSRSHPYLDKKVYAIKPLFSRYIFAQFNAERLQHKIRFTRGIQHIVNFGGHITPVDDEVISLIQSQITDDGLVHLNEKLQPNDIVMIKEGPLKNFVGVFLRETGDSERIMLLLEAVSYQARVLIEKDLIRKIA